MDYEINALNLYPEITTYLKDVVMSQIQSAMERIVVDSASKHVISIKHKYMEFVAMGTPFKITEYDFERLKDIISLVNDPNAIERATKREIERAEKKRLSRAKRKLS